MKRIPAIITAFAGIASGFLYSPAIISLAYAAEEAGHAASESASHGHGSFGITFLFIAILLIVANLSGFIEKWGQPAVLGELVAGVILTNLTLIVIPYFYPINTNYIITFLA